MLPSCLVNWEREKEKKSRLETMINIFCQKFASFKDACICVYIYFFFLIFSEDLDFVPLCGL